MRFLLTTPRKAAASARSTNRKCAVAVKESPHSLTNWDGTRRHRTEHNDDVTTATATRFGQQCGLNCGCVARLELDVVVSKATGQATVLAATYKAKQILTSAQNVPWTTTKGRLQFITSPCSTLHTLLEQTVQFVPGKSLRQLQAYTDFTGLRSSEAFGLAVLQQHQLAAASFLSQQRHAHMRQQHCFDLVEDIVTAAVRGYMPSPRRNPDQQRLQQKIHRFLVDDEYQLDCDGEIPCPPHRPLQEESFFGDHWSKSFTMWPSFSNELQQDHDGSTSGSGGKTSRRWTALDWMDYHWELIQQQEEQNRSLRDEQEFASELAASRRDAADANTYKVKDWLSYVDLQREHEDQSA